MDKMNDKELLSKEDRKKYSGMFDKIMTLHYSEEAIEERQLQDKREKRQQKTISKFGLN